MKRKLWNALAYFGPLARPAVPRIVPLLHADDDDARAGAWNALREIDPEALTNALRQSQKNAK